MFLWRRILRWVSEHQSQTTIEVWVSYKIFCLCFVSLYAENVKINNKTIQKVSSVLFQVTLTEIVAQSVNATKWIHEYATKKNSRFVFFYLRAGMHNSNFMGGQKKCCWNIRGPDWLSFFQFSYCFHQKSSQI